MKSILTMAWTAEDPSAFELAAKLARAFDARVTGMEPPSYGVMSMAWADAGMGAPIGGGLAEDAEERQRVAAVKQAFEQRLAGLASEWRAADDSGPTAIGVIGRAYDMIVMPQPGPLPKMPESVFETALFDSGRPVLVVPAAYGGMVGKKILFAWNGSTESARAISLAMPMLSKAESIEVMSVDGAGGMVTGAELGGDRPVARRLRFQGHQPARQARQPLGRPNHCRHRGFDRRRLDRQGRLHAKPAAPDDLRRHDPTPDPEFAVAGALLLLKPCLRAWPRRGCPPAW